MSATKNLFVENLAFYLTKLKIPFNLILSSSTFYTVEFLHPETFVVVATLSVPLSFQFKQFSTEHGVFPFVFPQIVLTMNNQSYSLTYQAPTIYRQWAQFYGSRFAFLLFQKGTFYLFFFYPAQQTDEPFSTQLWDYQTKPVDPNVNVVLKNIFYVIRPIHFSGMSIEANLFQKYQILLHSILAGNSNNVHKLLPSLIPDLTIPSSQQLKTDTEENTRLTESRNLLERLFIQNRLNSPYRFWFQFLYHKHKENALPFVREDDFNISKLKSFTYM